MRKFNLVLLSLFLLFFDNLVAKEIIVLTDCAYEPNLKQYRFLTGAPIQAAWENRWQYHLWANLQQALNQQGYSVRFFNSAVLVNDLLKFINKCDYIIDARGNLDQHVFFWYNLKLDLTNKLILVAWEPRIFCPNLWKLEFHKKVHKMLVWNDNLVDGQKYFLFRYPVYTNFNLDLDHLIPFADKKLQCLIAGNKNAVISPADEPAANYQDLYKERLKYINFCEEHNLDFDLYGRGWPKNRKSYRGQIGHYDKSQVLKQYKFSICYESSREVGYVTEKIFDCYRAGCVPVYYGAYNIDEMIPANCFVDRRLFEDDLELYQYLINMPESEYLNYLQNIKNYLNHDAKQFSADSFVQAVLNTIK